MRINKFSAPAVALACVAVFTILRIPAAPAGDVVSSTPANASTRPAIRTIELTCLDEQATGYGTFQSHNQKVLSNDAGIFTTHVHSRNEPYTAQLWRLSRSTDGGKAFSTLFESTDATHPPVIETDEQSNIYLARSADVEGNAYFYRFAADKQWKEPAITQLAGAAAGKFVLLRDAARKQIYFSSLPGLFFVLGEDGQIKSSARLFMNGPSALHHYPLLSLDDDGTLHYAWTTTPIDQRYLYWSIQHMQSKDGGMSWEKLDGTPIELPVIADETGPSDLISGRDEFQIHTWLSNMIATNGKLHFLYQADAKPVGEHYVRYDVKTAKRDRDVYPEFKGETLSLRGLDGFFAVDRSKTETIYAIGHDANSTGIVCLVSPDNGDTWHDFAKTSGDGPKAPYAVGGCREVTADGYVIGSFTDIPPGGAERVFVFKFATR